MTTTQSNKTDRLGDIAAIEQALYRYARGVDRKNWDLVASAYHPDAHDNHGNYKGPVAGFLASLDKRHANITQSMHMITNVIVEFNADDSALVESYFLTFQRLTAGAGPSRLMHLNGEVANDTDAVDNEVVGRYVDHMTRRDGEWRIQRRDVLFDIYRSKIAPRNAAVNPALTMSMRDNTDLLHVRRKELGL